jgi:hypothetical protein
MGGFQLPRSVTRIKFDAEVWSFFSLRQSADGAGLNGAILGRLEKVTTRMCTFIDVPWIKAVARRVSARRFKGTWRQGQLPNGQTAKARPDYRVQSLHKGHGRHRFHRIQTRY